MTSGWTRKAITGLLLAGVVTALPITAAAREQRLG